MGAFSAWWARMISHLPIKRKAAYIAQRQRELDEKMVRLTQGVERIADERDRTRRASDR
jgi:hypothetical protein